MKTAFKILGGLVLLVFVAIGAALYMTRGVVDTADAFFQALREDRADEARDHLSEGFLATTDSAALMRFLDGSQIRRVQSANWHSRSISGSQGRLEGTLTTENGGSVPVSVGLVKERGAWKIHWIERNTPGLFGPAATTTAPSSDEAVELVRTTTRDFVISLDASSMTHFHGTLSRLWQSQYSVAELDEVYRVFLDPDTGLGVLNRLTPQIASAPELDDDGVLTVAGHYATEPNRVRFSYRYVMEDSAWKPLGLAMNIGGD